MIFLVSGFWHGANWTFIAWGAYHALLFLPLILLGRNRKYTDTVAQGRLLPNAKEFAQMLVTFLLAVVGWIIFRAETIGQAGDYIYRMITVPAATLIGGKKALLFVFIMLLIEWFRRDRQHAMQLSGTGLFRYRAVRWGVYIVVISFILLFSGEHSDFIYFQF